MLEQLGTARPPNGHGGPSSDWTGNTAVSACYRSGMSPIQDECGRDEPALILDDPVTHPIETSAVREFVLAGHAIFTLVSRSTGQRLTFRVMRAEVRPGDSRPAPWFVGVLTGPDNTTDYAFLGTVFAPMNFKHSAKSRIGPDAQSVKAFTWFIRQLSAGRSGSLGQVEIYHEGRCCRCGRPLTTPSSVASGIGPVCAEKMAA